MSAKFIFALFTILTSIITYYKIIQRKDYFMSQNAIPYTFIPGTKAKATEVNANFTFLKDKVDGIQTSLSSTSGELDTFMSDTQTDIQELQNAKCDKKLNQSGFITNCIIKAPNGVVSYSGNNVTAYNGLTVLIPNGKNEDGSLKNIQYTLENDVVKDFSNTTISGALYIDNAGTLHAYATEKEGTSCGSTFSGVFYNTSTNFINPVASGVVNETIKLCRIGEIDVESGSINSFTSYQPLQLYPQNICKTLPSSLSTATTYNFAAIVENYYNNDSGYIVFSDGFTVQWGLSSTLGHNQYETITLLKAYTSTFFKVFTQRKGVTNNWTVSANPATSSTICIGNHASDGNSGKIMWMSIGY